MLHIHILQPQIVFVPLLLLDEPVNAIEGDPAVVADDPAPPVGVGKPGDQAAVTGGSGFLIIDPEYPVIVGGAVEKFILYLPGELVSIGFAGVAGHFEAAEGIDSPFEGAVGLQSYNDFFIFVQVSRFVVKQGSDGLGIDIQHPAKLLLQGHEILQFVHQPLGPFCSGSQKVLISGVRGVVYLDKIPDVNLFLPSARHKAFPRCSHISFLPVLIHSPPPDAALFRSADNEKGQHPCDVAQTVGM